MLCRAMHNVPMSLHMARRWSILLRRGALSAGREWDREWKGEGRTGRGQRLTDKYHTYPDEKGRRCLRISTSSQRESSKGDGYFMQIRASQYRNYFGRRSTGKARKPHQIVGLRFTIAISLHYRRFFCARSGDGSMLLYHVISICYCSFTFVKIIMERILAGIRSSCRGNLLAGVEASWVTRSMGCQAVAVEWHQNAESLPICLKMIPYNAYCDLQILQSHALCNLYQKESKESSIAV